MFASRWRHRRRRFVAESVMGSGRERTRPFPDQSARGDQQRGHRARERRQRARVEPRRRGAVRLELRGDGRAQCPQLVHVPGPEAENAAIGDAIDEGKAWSGDYMALRKDKSIVLVHTSVSRYEVARVISSRSSPCRTTSPSAARSKMLRQDEEHLQAAFAAHGWVRGAGTSPTTSSAGTSTGGSLRVEARHVRRHLRRLPVGVSIR